MAGEYTVAGHGRRRSAPSSAAGAPTCCRDAARAPNIDRVEVDDKIRALADVVPPRPPGFCTGCPERPIFSAMKLVEKELGPHHIAADIGCHLFSILPPFNIGATTMGYGLGPASASAFNVPASKRSISMMGDGGFWHNGLTSGIGNAVFNQHDGVIVVVDNYYSAATGGQDIPSSRADNRSRSTKHPIVEAVKGVGAKWVRQIDRTYDVAQHARHAARGADDEGEGAEDHRRLVGMHAEQAAPREAAGRQGGRQARRARRARALRCRRGHLHRRPRLHPPVRLPVAVGEADRPIR